LNTPALGDYADYLLDEILPFVEAHYRSNGRRAIMGRSSGGYAALYHAMTRPGLFQALAPPSGGSFFLFMSLSAIARLHRNLARYGGLDGLMEDTKKNTPKDQAFYDTISILTWAATFAPNPNAPHGFDLPIDLETGALREDVWERCLVYDPVRLIKN